MTLGVVVPGTSMTSDPDNEIMDKALQFMRVMTYGKELVTDVCLRRREEIYCRAHRRRSLGAALRPAANGN